MTDTTAPTVARRFLDQAIEAATPFAGGKVRTLLLELRHELDRVDALRAVAQPDDPHAHVCLSCSPDGTRPGRGCLNCRNTGMDQTPCIAPGHEPQCPHGCCDKQEIS